ncbi:MAG: transporter [Planctomycetes bacterium]|nr:transporter [Planctomycetota bacterium]
MRSRCLLVIVVGLLGSCHPALAQTAASLGAPMKPADIGQPSIETASFKATIRASGPDPLIGEYSPAARLGPISEVRLGPGPSSPEVFNDPQERYNWGVSDRYSSPPPPRYEAKPVSNSRPSQSQSLFGEKVGEMFEKGDGKSWFNFESDHCFDDFISPVSNPFLAEDPRTLTELRPIFLYQSMPSNQYLYRGGSAVFFGLQGRLAITERFSIVMNKLGGIAIFPGSGSTLDNSSGLSEIWIGPKYTFYREDQTGTIAAAGLIFQIPTGPASVYQDTGSLSLAPYVSFAQRFGKTSWGTFNVMDTLGMSFSTDSVRSNYLYNSFHIDFDVANYNKIFPLIELNWFHYTRNGSDRNLGFEGHDLFNAGAAVAGRDFLSLAFGARYKVSEALQFGGAVDFPLLGTKDLHQFRFGLDMIWRY